VYLCWGNKGSNTQLTLTRPRVLPDLPLDLGSNAYIQMAVATTDVYRSAEEVRSAGGTVVREPGPVPGIGTKVAKVADPDGWIIAFVDVVDFNRELCEAGSGSDGLCQGLSV
jgi:lactoylglutathione lyase